MLKSRFRPQEICELLGVTMHALRKWRNPARLRQGTEDPLFLPASHDPADRRVVWYDRADLISFLHRNERYAEKVITCMTPAHIHEQLRWADCASRPLQG